MPRKPTWDDVQRHTDGRFAPRTRVKEAPGIVKSSITAVLVICCMPLLCTSLAMLSPWLAQPGSALLILAGLISGWPLSHFYFRHRPWWYALLLAMATFGLILWAGASAQR